ncbi:hypothetical protein P170DRAFT_54912 [Aspergillus steynii IBT 23096]|uniref:Copper-fist domain-containing protein n=1 Tax=Aspergillus steynii IBT 23096 TaxID=1392250 RepID=A0A2I2FSC8_9EURO|nr:uncharacterized protein P170DRAFT_54912 [Aspergillus steynii IBT 23096]PLB43532.1 hypothetical protein P170DRAFT_54912 [Aspergillus steynii IBT 23096]
MPLDEEGAKWSCEPCIRGHRSSKCQHFDRLMMKVPKAGRPLAKCPHPKGTCSCQKSYAFMIRIPKGTTCLCRPVYQVPVDPGDPAPAMTPTPAPLAPTPSPGPGKIQKSSKRQVKTAPETIAKALHSIPDFKEQQTVNGKPSGLSPYSGNSPDSLGLGADTPGAFQPQRATLPENTKPQGGSCCSGKSKQPTPPPQPKSCCKKSDSPVKNGHFEGESSERRDVSYTSSLNGNSYTPVSAPPFSPWQDFQATGQNQYIGPFSFDQPQTGTSAYHHNYLSQMPSNGSFGFPNGGISSNIEFNQSVLPSSLPHEPQNLHPTPGSFDNEPAHDCSCGEGCQCLGCASHPFNNTTRQHVQEMGLLVALDGEQTLEGFNGFQSPPVHGNYPGVPPVDYSLPAFNHTMPSSTPHMGMQTYGELGTTSNQLSNGYSSPPAEYTSGQNLMEPSEYYTLEYPVGLPSGCSDVTGSCQCGNDCCCVGCLTHSGHDGFSLEATTAASIEATTVTAGEPDSSTYKGDAMSGIPPSSTSML